MTERAHDLGEFAREQRRRTLFAHATLAADSSLERADARVLIGPWQTVVAVGEPDRDARPADGARTAAELGEVREAELEVGGQCGPRLEAHGEAPARKGVPVGLVGLAGALSVGDLHVVLGARGEALAPELKLGGSLVVGLQGGRPAGRRNRRWGFVGGPERELHAITLTLRINSVKQECVN